MDPIARGIRELCTAGHRVALVHGGGPQIGGMLKRLGIKSEFADGLRITDAVVIGDVEIGEGANVWYHCVLRGDTNFIRVGPRSNIQDGTIVHVNAGRQCTVIGADVTVGHAAIVHACTLEDRAFVGMGATVLDGAVIEEGGVLGAGSVLPPGKRVGRLELVDQGN